MYMYMYIHTCTQREPHGCSEMASNNVKLHVYLLNHIYTYMYIIYVYTQWKKYCSGINSLSSNAIIIDVSRYSVRDYIHKSLYTLYIH